MAYTVLAMLPILLVYPFLQLYFVKKVILEPTQGVRRNHRRCNFC